LPRAMAQAAPAAGATAAAAPAPEPRQALLAAAEALGLEPVSGGPSAGPAAGEAQATAPPSRAPEPAVDLPEGSGAAGVGARPGRGRRLPQSFQAAEVGQQALPELRFAGRRLYAATEGECSEACAALLQPSADDGRGKEVQLAFGFDIEWRASFQRGVAQPPAATVQLASRELAVVFHLSRCGCLPEPLAALLGRPDVLKVGVGAEGDAHKLERDFPSQKPGCGAGAAAEASERFRARGVLDLNDLASRALAGRPGARPRCSLAALCEELLRHRLPKPPDVRCSNWEAAPLSEEQLHYAATDAWAGFRCLEELRARAPEALAEVAAALRADTVPSAATARKRPAPPDGRQREPVAATASPSDLPPAKRCVYRLFFENGLAADSIAELRGIQTSTVLGYLADAIAAGYAYDLADFELADADREAIVKALSALPQTEMPRSSLKAVKEALPEHIDYWAIRLVQAHLARAGAASDSSA